MITSTPLITTLKSFGIAPFITITLLIAGYIYKVLKNREENKIQIRKEQIEKIFELYTDNNKKDNKFILEDVFSYRFGTNIPYDTLILLTSKNNIMPLNNRTNKTKIKFLKDRIK